MVSDNVSCFNLTNYPFILILVLAYRKNEEISKQKAHTNTQSLTETF